MDFENTIEFDIDVAQGTSSLQKLQHSRVINSSLASDELYKAEMFGEMRQSQPGILAHSKTIEGILYDQVVSGERLFAVQISYHRVSVALFSSLNPNKEEHVHVPNVVFC